LYETNRWERVPQWEKILDIAQQQNDVRFQLTAWGGLAMSWVDLNESDSGNIDQERLRRAITCLERQLELAHTAGDQLTEINSSWNLSLALAALDPLSIEDLDHALDLMQVYIDYPDSPDKKQAHKRIRKLRTRRKRLATPRELEYSEAIIGGVFEPSEE
jgi:hypothetical protein